MNAELEKSAVIEAVQGGDHVWLDTLTSMDMETASYIDTTNIVFY